MMAELANLSKEDDYRGQKRAECDVLYTRLTMLEPADRIIVEMHLLHGVSFKELGLLTGESPEVLSKRVDHCVRSLLGGRYIVVLRNRKCYSQDELAVAYDLFLMGMGYRAISKKRGIGPGVCRGIIKRLKERVNK